MTEGRSVDTPRRIDGCGYHNVLSQTTTFALAALIVVPRTTTTQPSSLSSDQQTGGSLDEPGARSRFADDVIHSLAQAGTARLSMSNVAPHPAVKIHDSLPGRCITSLPRASSFSAITATGQYRPPTGSVPRGPWCLSSASSGRVRMYPSKPNPRSKCPGPLNSACFSCPTRNRRHPARVLPARRVPHGGSEKMAVEWREVRRERDESREGAVEGDAGVFEMWCQIVGTRRGLTKSLFSSSCGRSSLDTIRVSDRRASRPTKNSPSVRRALPPVGWQRTVEQEPQRTTVWAWEKTVVMLKQPASTANGQRPTPCAACALDDRPLVETE